MSDLVFNLRLATNAKSLSEDDSEVLKYAVLDYLRNGFKADMADGQLPFNIKSIDVSDNEGQISVIFGDPSYVSTPSV